MPAPGSPCAACAAPTRIRYRARGGPRFDIDAAAVRCTSPDLASYDDIWACPSCGLAYQVFDESGTAALLQAYADVEDPDYLAEEPQRRAEFRSLLRRVEMFRLPPGRLLEVGSYAGLCLDEAAHRGWDAVGVEPSRWAAAHARRAHDATVVDGTLSAAIDQGSVDENAFDVVASFDVLEHLVDPAADLRRAGALLAPGGVLAITTVNIAGLGARVLRGRWPWLMGMHLWYFTPASLRVLLTRAGLQVLTVETHAKALTAGYVLRRAENWGGLAARAARAAARRLSLDDRVVRINLGDVLLAVARKAGDGEDASAAGG